MKKTLLLAGVASLFAMSANAYDIKDYWSPYIGADYNFTRTHHPESTATVASNILPSNYHSGTFAFGTKVFDYVAVEGFAEFSKYENKPETRSYTRAYGADVMGVLGLGDSQKFDLLGSIGLGRYYNKLKHKTAAGKTDFAEYDWGYRFGAGAQYHFNENWSVRAMYRHVVFNKPKFAYNNLDVVSLGVRYNF